MALFFYEKVHEAHSPSFWTFFFFFVFGMLVGLLSIATNDLPYYRKLSGFEQNSPTAAVAVLLVIGSTSCRLTGCAQPSG